ncbi:uncharacterized protein O3C94_015055 [Discoglossus pictus]
MPKMKLYRPALLSTLTFLTIVSAPQGKKEVIDHYEKWNYREGAGKVNILGTRSITGTLEKWANEIFNEGKNMLMYQPQILLPDYTGIRSLSEALDHVLRDVNALKKRLGELNERFDGLNRAVIRKKLRMAPMNPAAPPKRLNSFLQGRQVKITQPPHRPYPVRRRVYIRRRKVKN